MQIIVAGECDFHAFEMKKKDEQDTESQDK